MSRLAKVFVVNAMIFVFLLSLVELVLLMLHYQRGIKANGGSFAIVNELVLLKGYCVDGSGISKIDPEVASDVNGYVSRGQIKIELVEEYERFRQGLHQTPYRVGRDFVEVKQGLIDNEFTRYYRSILGKESKDDMEQSYLNYVDSPINSDGFRSIQFRNDSTKSTKLLLLGDSFTWGHTVENLTSSFADILSARGYAVYNSGIVGADIPQYHGVAKKYLPIIKPDFVIVNLYLGNDIYAYNRDLSKGLPVLYSTNAGNLSSCPHGIYFYTAQEAYDQIFQITRIPPNSAFNQVMSASRITTSIWQVLADHGLMNNVETEQAEKYWKSTKRMEVGYSINRIYLDSISRLCKTHQVQMIVSIIPSLGQFEPDNLGLLLDGFPYIQCLGFNKDDYSSKDGHFNEKGHEKYASFLDDFVRNRSVTEYQK